MDDMLPFGKRILSDQPFSAHLGTELVAFGPGKAVLTLATRDHFKQQHGFVHGGVISYLADNALTFAGGSVLGDCVTTGYTINYVRPAVGESLIARATVVSASKRLAVCTCNVFAVAGEDEVLVAVAQGTISKTA